MVLILRRAFALSVLQQAGSRRSANREYVDFAGGPAEVSMHAKPRPNPSLNEAELGVVDKYRDRVACLYIANRKDFADLCRLPLSAKPDAARLEHRVAQLLLRGQCP